MKIKLLVILSILIGNNTHAAKIRTVSLIEALENARKKNAEIKQEEFEITKAEQDISLIKGKFHPQFDIMAGVGPINKAYGNALNSQNSEVTEVRNWRALYLVSVKGTYPIYAWGQKHDLMNAAKLNVKINQEKVKIKVSEIDFKVKELYYGNLLAANSLDFIKETLDEVEGVIKKIKKNKSDLYRLRIFQNLLKSKKEEVEAQYNLSLEALKFYIGEGESDQLIKPKDEWLELERRELAPLNTYLEILNRDKPELKQLRDGILAKRSLAKGIKKSGYPRLGLLMKYEYAHTNARETQDSVFAYDPYNENSLVLGVGFMWNLNFGVTKSESSKHRVDSLKLEAKKRMAMRGLGLLVQKSWQKVSTLQSRVRSAGKASKFAKKLLSRTLIGGGMGLLKGKDIVEAYQARILTFKEYFQTVYDYNIAWAGLSLAVGREVDPILVSE